ncbi:hypothetical protein PIB30_057308 [Stylosanthes scabra]|uniref:Uncharacterized protein n=1 Tax=Stylosanthes scabra TaxID=79078 RepID=A0ABU6YI76_9FABA|nr:hypothetical protein [Stylosanthes scabra]
MASSESSGAPQAPAFYMDEHSVDKWTKFSKKEGSTSFSRRSLLNKTKSKSSKTSWCGKCAKLVKQQRARFYIFRRCVVMLICWSHYSD